MTSDPPPPETNQPPRRDTLTIGRFLLLTAGVAIGLGVFSPVENHDQQNQIELNLDYAIVFYNAALIGISLPAPLFIIGQRVAQGAARRSRRTSRRDAGAGGDAYAAADLHRSSPAR